MNERRTPREILLARYQGIEPELDAIRAGVIANLASTAKEHSATASMGFREFLLSLRWHLAGMAAVWLLVLALGQGDQPAQQSGIAGTPDAPSLLASLYALREFRRELTEAEPPPPPRVAPAPVPHALWIPGHARPDFHTFA